MSNINDTNPDNEIPKENSSDDSTAEKSMGPIDSTVEESASSRDSTVEESVSPTDSTVVERDSSDNLTVENINQYNSTILLDNNLDNSKPYLLFSDLIKFKFLYSSLLVCKYKQYLSVSHWSSTDLFCNSFPTLNFASSL